MASVADDAVDACCDPEVDVGPSPLLMPLVSVRVLSVLSGRSGLPVSARVMAVVMVSGAGRACPSAVAMETVVVMEERVPASLPTPLPATSGEPAPMDAGAEERGAAVVVEGVPTFPAVVPTQLPGDDGTSNPEAGPPKGGRPLSRMVELRTAISEYAPKVFVRSATRMKVTPPVHWGEEGIP